MATKPNAPKPKPIKKPVKPKPPVVTPLDDDPNPGGGTPPKPPIKP